MEGTQGKGQWEDGGSQCWSQVHRLFPPGHGSCLCLEKKDLALGLLLLVGLTVFLAGSDAGPEE